MIWGKCHDTMLSEIKQIGQRQCDMLAELLPLSELTRRLQPSLPWVMQGSCDWISHQWKCEQKS